MSSRDGIRIHISNKRAETEFIRQKKLEKEEKDIGLLTYLFYLILIPLFALPLTWYLFPKTTVAYWNVTMLMFCGEEYFDEHARSMNQFVNTLVKHIKNNEELKEDE